MERNQKVPTDRSAPNETRSRQLLVKRDSDSSQTSSTIATDATNNNKRRLPPSRVPVGLAKSPDLKNCRSKVGSLNNIKHLPAGGKVCIPTQKLNWNAKSKVGSLENKEHKPAGGDIKVESKKLEWKTSSKVQSLANISHKPGGGNVKIFNDTYRHKSATPKLDNGSNKEAQGTSAGANTREPTTVGSQQAKRPVTAIVARGMRPGDQASARLACGVKNISLGAEK